jgi:anaerobic C4-dicarboxylate transporter
MKLFEIVKEIANCIKRVDSDDYINVESGEIIDTEALDALKVELDVKIENIGKWILNHSFMMPGLITTITSIAVGLLLIQIF